MNAQASMLLMNINSANRVLQALWMENKYLIAVHVFSFFRIMQAHTLILIYQMRLNASFFHLSLQFKEEGI